MNVSPTSPFQIIYSLFEHQYLGYLFDSFVVQRDEAGRLTFSHQNISSKNAKEFDSGLDETDYALIKIMDSMQPDVLTKQFNKKKLKVNEFLLKTFDKNSGNEVLQDELKRHGEIRRSKILPLLRDKMLFEMGIDGEPTWKEIEVLPEPATVLFHFRRNEENTHYFPTIKYQGEKIEYQYKDGYILCTDPAFLVLEGKLYHFAKNIDANKIKPFLNKKFIAIPRAIEDNYYRKFVAQLVASFDVYAKGFEIKTEDYPLSPRLSFSKLASQQKTLSLFDSDGEADVLDQEDEKILFELSFDYGNYNYTADKFQKVSVHVEHQDDEYTFHRIKRDIEKEKKVIRFLEATDLSLRHACATLSTAKAFSWIRHNEKFLADSGVILRQIGNGGKKYFLGTSEISIEVNENIDWFDIKAIIKFGEFEIPFKVIRNYILGKKQEIELPNGEIAIIPEEWFYQYAELFAFSEEMNDTQLSLKKHHLALVNELKDSNMAKVQLNRQLEILSNSFEKIQEYPLSKSFKGILRPYQKAGYNWMNFLRESNFGGCLADDMGLGKTVQTLALLQNIKEQGVKGASLLVMPTSLVYNWEKESEKFTPQLKILNYTGVRRLKNTEEFIDYDLVLTSYGIIRQDLELLREFHFNYIILDESQVIKNPDSNITKAVKELKSKYKLILTGTPIENSTLDLWSQMTFLNPGLLGTKSFFKNNFQLPIEKKQDELQTKKLHTIIKPFLLRRHKSQVATDLPEKIETIRYCTMSEEQESAYEEVKSSYRNEIMNKVESGEINKSRFLIIQGLTKLRQIANHPKMIDELYTGLSGKLDEINYMLQSALENDHKILVFSQFVKHLTIVSDHLKAEKIDFCYLDGSTRDREAEVNRFQDNDAVKVFLISLKAGGLGLNLTKADYVFLLDPWWNPAIEAQAIDRAHRIGQKNTVFTYRFITKNSVEEKIMLLQNNKKKLASDLITTEESFVKNLSKEDLANILD
jgi:SNF2 family DNA or RNA helicase